MQATISMYCCQPVTPQMRYNALVCYCMQYTVQALLCIVNGDDSTLFRFFLSLVTLTFDLDIQTSPSEGPNTSYL